MRITTSKAGKESMGEDSVMPADLVVAGNRVLFFVRNRDHFLRVMEFLSIIKDIERDGNV